jgi:hypothetical protein
MENGELGIWDADKIVANAEYVLLCLECRPISTHVMWSQANGVVNSP